MNTKSEDVTELIFEKHRLDPIVWWDDRHPPALIALCFTESGDLALLLDLQVKPVSLADSALFVRVQLELHMGSETIHRRDHQLMAWLDLVYAALMNVRNPRSRCHPGLSGFGSIRSLPSVEQSAIC